MAACNFSHECLVQEISEDEQSDNDFHGYVNESDEIDEDIEEQTGEETDMDTNAKTKEDTHT